MVRKQYTEYKYFWKADRWNGGQSEDSRIGLPGAFRFGIGNDIRSDSGYLSVAKKPVLHDLGKVLDEIHWMEPDPNTGDVYYYGHDYIYKEADGVTTRIHQVTEDASDAQGLAYFDHAMYYRTPTKLGQLDLNTDLFDDDWQTGLATTRFWGPMCNVKNVLLVGHGRYVGTIDDVQFWNPQALTLPPGYFCRDIFRAGSFAVILATFGERITDSDQGMMFLWDTTSDVYNDFIPIDGNPHAGIAQKNKITIFAGQQPTIQESLGGQTTIVQGIPSVEDGKIAEIYPGAVDIWRNMIHFGISDGDSETVTRCVWNYGAKNSKFSDVLNPEFPTSVYDASQDMADLIGAGMQITAVKKIGTTLRFAWKKTVGSGESAVITYGIDQIDTTKYQKESIHRSLAFDRLSPYEKSPVRALVELKGKLLIGEQVQITVSPDPYEDPTFTDTETLVSMTEDEVGVKLLEMPFNAEENQIRSRDLHIETRLRGTGNTRPSVKREWIQVMEDSDQI